MRRALLVATVLAAGVMAIVACVGDDPTPNATPESDSGSDAPTPPAVPPAPASDGGVDGDAGSPACDPTAPFGDLVLLTELSASDNASDNLPFLSDDETEIWFVSERGGTGASFAKIYNAKRSTREGTFSTPTEVAIQVDAGVTTYIERAALTSDKKTIYFTVRVGVPGNVDYKIWVAQRIDPTGAFGPASLVTGINAPESVGAVFVNGAGSRLYFGRETAASSNLFHLASVECTSPAACGTQRAFPEIDTPVLFGDGAPVLDRTETTLIFSSNRDAGTARHDLYLTTRASIAASFGPVTPLKAAPGATISITPGWLSPDGCRLYVDSNKNGNYDIFVMTRGK
jgi:hypothetical protein